jgi:hypothetical protein
MALVQFTGYPSDHPGVGQAGSWIGAGTFEPGEVKIVADELADEMIASGVFAKAPKDAEVGVPKSWPKAPKPKKGELVSAPTEGAPPEAVLETPVADSGPAPAERG